VRLPTAGLTLFALVASFCVAADAAAPPPSGAATLIEGAVSLLRGTSKYRLVEGVRLRSGDVIEVSDPAGTALIEFPGAAVVGFGGRTRVMVLSATNGRVDLFFLSGTAKAAVPKAAAPVHLSTALGSVTVANAVAVLEVAPRQIGCFAESGDLLFDLAPPIKIKTGEFCARQVGQRPVAAARPPQSFVAALPRAFLDALPSRMARVADRDVTLSTPQAFGYADVAEWLASVPTVRRLLVAYWAGKARDPGFRQALIAHLNDLPEWDPVLFPEKYVTKERKLP
jgi:hypothetical protein